MSAGPILLIHAGDAWAGEDGLEWLRVAAALVATGHTVRLVETAPVLDGDDLPDGAGRIVEQLAAFGIEPEPLAPGMLEAARAVLRLGPPGRSGTPSVASVAEVGEAAWCQAGQLVR